MTSLSIKDFDAAIKVDATSKGGVAKLVKAWESKNNERAKRVAGLGLMAVSLAACGGSDTTPDTTPISQAEYDAAVSAKVAAEAQAAAAAAAQTAAEADTAAAETAQASAEAAQAAAEAQAVAAATAQAAAEAAQVAAEADAATAATAQAAAEAAAAAAATAQAAAEAAQATAEAARLTAEQALADLETDLAPLTGGALTAGTDTIVLLRDVNLSGDAVNFTDAQTDIVIGLGGNTLTLAAIADMATTGVASGIDDIVINVAMAAAAGGFDVSLANVANGVVTINTPVVVRDVFGNDATEHDVTVTGAGNVTVVAGDSVATLDVTMALDASTVVRTGSATSAAVRATSGGSTTAANETISVVTGGNIGLTATGAATLNVSGTGDVTLVAASTDLNGGRISGAAGQTLIVADVADVNATSVSGFDAIRIDTAGATDARGFATSIELVDGALAVDTLTVADGASVVMLGADDTITLDVNDGAVANSNTSSATLALMAATTATGSGVTVEGTSDTIGTLNVSSDVNHTAGNFIVTNAAALTVNLSGAGNFAFVKAGAGATVLNASAMTGALSATAGLTMLSITSGSGDDTITAASGLAFALEGGAGTDRLVAVADMTAGTFSNFEIMRAEVGSLIASTTTYDFNASQLSGASLVIDGIGLGLGTATLSIDGTVAGVAGSVNLSTIDLSGLQFADTSVSTIVNVSTIDTTQFLATQSFTITGSDAADAITGSANADVISGGAGVDAIIGGAGADVISGGDDADVITGGVGADVLTGGAGIDTFAFANGDSGITVATADVITDFATTVDHLDFDGYTAVGSTYTEADGSAAADFTALVALADAAMTATGVGPDADDVYVSYNALGTGDAYVFFDASGDGSFGAGDTLVILSGVSTAADILAADFI